MTNEMRREIAAMLRYYEAHVWRTIAGMQERHPDRPALSVARAAIMAAAKEYGPHDAEDAALLRLIRREEGRETSGERGGLS